jgi:hypothetical protein
MLHVLPHRARAEAQHFRCFAQRQQTVSNRRRVNARRFSSLSAAAQTDELGLGADVVLHGAFDVCFDGAGLEVKFRVEGVELK